MDNSFVTSENLGSSTRKCIVMQKTCISCGTERRPLFRLPDDHNRIATWLRILHKGYLLDAYTLTFLRSNVRVCPNHFGDASFTSTLRNRLTKFAVPEISEYDENVPPPPQRPPPPSMPPLPSRPPPVLQDITDVATYATKEFPAVQSRGGYDEIFVPVPSTLSSSCVLTPKTKKIQQLKSNITKLRKQLYKVKKSGHLKDLKSNLTALQYEFVLSQLASNRIDPRGRRWSAKQKAIALNICFHSPSAYRVLRKVFAFPSKSTLTRSTGQIAKDVGFCPILLTALKERVMKMKPAEKICTLVFDEIAIKTFLSYNASIDCVDGYESAERINSAPHLATQALVFMVRGVTQNWKQVIAYYFRANSSPEFWFKTTFLTVLDLVRSIGLRVIATVCDQGPVNQALYRSLGTSSEMPFFERNGCTIFTIYDTPHLLKSVRNNMMNYNIHYLEAKETDDPKTLVGKWSDIREFYDRDIKRKYQSTSLTLKHLTAKGLASMKVKYAAQVFSHSVAAALELDSCRNGYDYFGTADFVGTMNNLYDSLNSKTKHFKTPVGCAVSDKSNHIHFWKTMCEWVRNWKFVNSSGKVIKPACQKGFIRTLNATIRIWGVLKTDISYLMTNRLNQDCLENTFSSVRRLGGFCDCPSTLHFRSTIRKVIVYSFLKKSSASNCEDDDDYNLLDSMKITLDSVAKFCDNENTECTAVIDDAIVPTFDVIEENIIAYVSGFLSKSYLKKVSCELCQSLLVGAKELDSHTLFIYFKEYKDTEYGLKWPTHDYFLFMTELSAKFFQCIELYYYKPQIRKNICAFLQDASFEFFSCVNHKVEAKQFIIESYATMMIKHKVKINNSNLLSKGPIRQMKHVRHL